MRIGSLYDVKQRGLGIGCVPCMMPDCVERRCWPCLVLIRVASLAVLVRCPRIYIIPIVLCGTVEPDYIITTAARDH